MEDFSEGYARYMELNQATARMRTAFGHGKPSVLAHTRKGLGLTLRQLGTLTKIHYSAWSRAEKGGVLSEPMLERLDSLVQLAKRCAGNGGWQTGQRWVRCPLCKGRGCEPAKLRLDE